jgi:hypothetical protein
MVLHTRSVTSRSVADGVIDEASRGERPRVDRRDLRGRLVHRAECAVGSGVRRLTVTGRNRRDRARNPSV